MNPEAADLPKVSLSRADWIRMIVVGILVVLALVRVVPDLVRVIYPLQVFGYLTDGNGLVVRAAVVTPSPKPSAVPSPVHSAVPSAAHSAAPSPTHSATAGRVSEKGKPPAAKPRRNLVGEILAKLRPSPPPHRGDTILVGDRVRLDRIKPFDRKPGLVGRGFTYDNRDRYLPIERHGEERILHLVARDESWPQRFLDILRIVLLVVAVGLGAILFLVKPSIATAAFFAFCLAGVEAPATWLDLAIPNPWRPVLPWIADTLRGAVRPALLLFTLCLIDGDTDAARERIFAWFTGVLALALGTANAYAEWSMNYAAMPAEHLDRVVKAAGVCVSALTAVALAIAFFRAHLNDRHRIGWIAAAFLFAGAARLASDTLYPAHIRYLWINGILVSMTIVPIVTIWIAVVRHQFFNVDFVVTRAVVYVALTASVIGTISVTEEIGTYLFYQNSDLAYGWLIAVSMAVGAFTGKIKGVLDRTVDHFIFRDRREQRQALEFIAGYILDAETVQDVYRALLQDAAHALKLAFGGILARQPDGSYALAENYNWPEDCVITLGPSDELTRAITRTRGALTFSGKDTRLIQQSFPNERLTFAAPIFFDRSVSGIVVYGHNVSGLDLDPEEREHLVRVVAHASIALNAIELARYRGAGAAAVEPLPSPAT